jgi:hypothetical protein
MSDHALLVTGAHPKAHGRPELRHAIGMHGWLHAQATKIDLGRKSVLESEQQPEVPNDPADTRGRPAVFKRIGPYTLAPGFNPGRWTTYVAGRPTVVPWRDNKAQACTQQ